MVKAGGAVLRHPSFGSLLVTALPPSSPLNWATQAATSPSLVGGGGQARSTSPIHLCFLCWAGF